MTEENTQRQDAQEPIVEERAQTSSRKTKIAVLVGAALFVFALAGMLVWQIQARNGKQSQDTSTTQDVSGQSNQAPVEELPKKVQRVIDGVLVERGKENFYPVAVMIENAAFGGVRPQSGLQEASVVYEALAEGGITRFMAVYASGEPLQRIGPVRSARPYYVDWAKEYGGLYVHAGGSPQALQNIATSSGDIEDVNQVGGHHAYFFRDSKAQAREHGLFTSTELLGYALRDRELSEAKGEYDGWLFQEKGLEKENRPTDERTITIPFSTASYQVNYAYQREKNVYARAHGNTAHTDALTGEQIMVKNVVVQYVDTGILEVASGRLRMTTVGSGKAIVFFNGEPHEATWKKESGTARTRFYDSSQTEIQFIPGNIWIEVVPTDRKVTYSMPALPVNAE